MTNTRPGFRMEFRVPASDDVVREQVRRMSMLEYLQLRRVMAEFEQELVAQLERIRDAFSRLADALDEEDS